ncbi:Uncharacterized protein BP5553_04860 [Venustampulla echinocandica]|uniref:SGNH hydrolase-type esterase domain-containing protein n=1 Tax=Venustampulla echinocandica TaxID=2656787 RepID=A0A370TPH3_9HELO|nr:Uncharacterized protein BP5553_04860 [Venustampulla echinocandica]RDL37427.1 Uncharacterized protein BP5553_04860 [Venustampulla echinocandica]
MGFHRPIEAALMVLALVEPGLSFPQPTQPNEASSEVKVPPRGVAVEWAVIGDSWASGVAYNLSNVYGRTDSEACYRTKESWGAQMEQDKSWSRDPQAFNFAACGGTLMDDLERQMKEKAGNPELVWGMFGGNNAYFGAIARACIYQPIDPGHPFGWGKPWDEDTGGTGLCKQNIQKAEDYLKKPDSMRKTFTNALDDILKVAQDKRALNYPFDLYVSSYVRFFDDTTDDCDGWTFAHDRLSVGQPKVVKGLRKIINDKVQLVNDIQADVIKNYKPPATTPKLPNVHVHNFQPDHLFDGHRFCEKSRTFEDQYYHMDLWLWNLQYYDEKTGEEVGVAIEKNGVKVMASPAGVNVTQGFQTVLGADTNPDAAIPQTQDPHTQQYGFGWTARPFHPKFEGHKALKDSFIQQMKDDKIPSVKSAPSPPKPQQKHECNGLGNKKYVSHDIVKDSIENHFCPDAVSKGPIEQKYNEGTPEEVIIKLTGPGGFKPSSDDCKKYLTGQIIDACDGNDPKNPENYKGGGKETIGDVVYEVQPQSLRQPADKGKQYGCDSSYKFLFNEYTVWGHGFDSADHGDALKGQLKGCALLPDTWHFDYGLGDDGREWTAKFRTGVFQKKCTGHAVKSAGAPNDSCSGSG